MKIEHSNYVVWYWPHPVVRRVAWSYVVGSFWKDFFRVMFRGVREGKFD